MFNLPFLSSDRTPISRTILLLLIVLAVLSVYALHLKAGIETSMLGWMFSVVSIGLGLAGWFMLERSSVPQLQEIESTRRGFGAGRLLIIAGAHVGVAGCFMLGYGMGASVVVAAAFLLLLICTGVARSSRLAGILLIPLTGGMVFVGVAATLGDPVVGIFPGVIAFLFVLVVKVTLDIERDVFLNHAEAKDHEIHHMFRKRLAWTASVFFLFGVVSLWPWLGAIYNQAYFWVLILGVLLPLVFFWGRLRQPRTEGARTALIRFNRVSPFIGIILLIAFAIG